VAKSPRFAGLGPSVSIQDASNRGSAHVFSASINRNRRQQSFVAVLAANASWQSVPLGTTTFSVTRRPWAAFGLRNCIVNFRAAREPAILHNN
jgi:hypothetical protein